MKIGQLSNHTLTTLITEMWHPVNHKKRDWSSEHFDV